MGKKRPVVVLLLLLANRVVVADLAPLTLEHAAWPPPSEASGVSNLPQDHANALYEPLILRLTEAEPIHGLAACSTAADTHWPSAAALNLPAARSGPAIQLPPPPSGSTLTLSGLLTLGAMQLARSVRDASWPGPLQTSLIPRSYRADAIRLGHSVSLQVHCATDHIPGILSPVTGGDSTETLYRQSWYVVQHARIHLQAGSAATPRPPPPIESAPLETAWSVELTLDYSDQEIGCESFKTQKPI